MEKVFSSTLVKVDRNGSKHYEEIVTCDRCGGVGGSKQWAYTGWTCLKCGGTGRIARKRIERTAEYAAKLEAKRAAKAEALLAESEAAQKEYEAREAVLEAARRAEEERIRAEKAKSQWVGQVGQRLAFEGTLDHRAWYEVQAFCGYGTERRFVYTFRDDEGNALVWKTGARIEAENGDRVKVTGTIKAHDEYDDEKQTVLTRCKVSAAA